MTIATQENNGVLLAEEQLIKDDNLPTVVTDNTAYKEMLKRLPEVQNMTSQIDINNQNSILLFGQEPSVNISRLSDQMLSSIKSVKPEECSKMLIELTKLMDKFDIQELEDPEKSTGFWARFKAKTMESLNKMFEKYEDMGKEVDKIYQILKGYENDIYKANEMLKKQYEANVGFYQELEKYIVAGEIGLEEIAQYKQQLNSRTDISSEEIRMQIMKVDMASELLSSRIQDLRIAENIAMQACPMIQVNQMANFNLLRKINSSFIITLPVFKQCLVTAINLRRQKIQADAIKQLDEKTNELLLRNAQNTANQSVAIAKMASSSSVNVETLEKTYQTIKNGIEETKRITTDLSAKRKDDATRLENMKQDMKNNGFV